LNRMILLGDQLQVMTSLAKRESSAGHGRSRSGSIFAYAYRLAHPSHHGALRTPNMGPRDPHVPHSCAQHLTRLVQLYM
jgi:hypothetical protein